ncbi:imm11 family protein [Sphingomonas sp. URHD0057]|uniref:imm11 family protein n=1 Tax=Sphingomonas sp. URHD0057 TaxID=1380389 RepID=UPI00048C09A6|nr:DUF1629 domain-containing protein [Sphingomonas sp. URHD0057]
MAWYIQTILLDEDRPKARLTPETLAAYENVCAAMTAEYQKLPRDNPLWDTESVQMIKGYDIPEFEPRVVIVKRRALPLPDIISTGDGWLVSNKVRQEIERIEPGRHRFLPTALEFDTGEREIDLWSFLIIRGRVDCVALEACVNVFKRVYNPDLPDFFRYLADWSNGTTIALRRSNIEGRAIWYDYRIDRRFISDGFADFIQRENIRGWRLTTWDRPNRAIEVD